MTTSTAIPAPETITFPWETAQTEYMVAASNPDGTWSTRTGPSESLAETRERLVELEAQRLFDLGEFEADAETAGNHSVRQLLLKKAHETRTERLVVVSRPVAAWTVIG